ncbi:hypothetical protein E5288_WYG019723 [Bos mutus]|uniref:Uncharacterized protein n=1 Tax=Bos mutus TaxID=72004 RepID=A0A6B0SBT0_9CETA|nr:hypothetical protein [Bos mutus]
MQKPSTDSERVALKLSDFALITRFRPLIDSARKLVSIRDRAPLATHSRKGFRSSDTPPPLAAFEHDEVESEGVRQNIPPFLTLLACSQKAMRSSPFCSDSAIAAQGSQSDWIITTLLGMGYSALTCGESRKRKRP